jgi:5-methylcytosine-specific restriction endonuclease McrA
VNPFDTRGIRLTPTPLMAGVIMILTIELVPETCHFKNVRSEITKNAWDKLRKECYKKADYHCEICGGRGPEHPVECHEIWHYDDKTFAQTLIGLIALCPACHEVKHMGLAQIKGHGNRAQKHFAKVNKLTSIQAKQKITKAFKQYHERSQHQWTLDISWLNDKLAEPGKYQLSSDLEAEVDRIFED